MKTTILLIGMLAVIGGSLLAAEPPLTFQDPKPQRYELTARASQIDPRTRPHPEIDFVFEKDGKPADVENATVDTRVKPQGKLVIWLMGYSPPLFERVNSYGLHAIQVHYANGWFGKFGNAAPPGDDKFLGKIRLEAATGEDFSDVVDIPKPDGMMERALQLVKWLAKENRPGRWDYFLTRDRHGLRWDRVIVAGASHGSTTAARFAKHQRVDRVVMFCGPRDQFETWQALPSATPANRFFGFQPRARRRLDGPPLLPVLGAAGPAGVWSYRERGSCRAALWQHAATHYRRRCEERRQTRPQFRRPRRGGGERCLGQVHSRGCVALPLHAPRGASRPAGAK